MKHMNFAIMFLSAALLLLSACSGTGSAVPDPLGSVSYRTMCVEWPVYSDVEELVAEGDEILIGTVTGVSYQVMDIRTGEPATEKTEEADRSFHTIYNVDVIKSYKGHTRDTVKISMLGGQKGVRVKEQLAALGPDAANGIPVVEGTPILDIGDSRLFVLYQYEDTMPTPVNVDQGVYDLVDPDGTDNGDASVTLRDIISYFGEEQWIDFQKLFAVDSQHHERSLNVEYFQQKGLYAEAIENPANISVDEMPYVPREQAVLQLKNADLILECTVETVSRIIIKEPGSDNTWFITQMTLSVDGEIHGDAEEQKICVVNAAVSNEPIVFLTYPGLEECREHMHAAFVLRRFDESDTWTIGDTEIPVKELGDYYISGCIGFDGECIQYLDYTIQLSELS